MPDKQQDHYADLPDHVKHDIDVRHGVTTEAEQAPEPLTREQELLQQAYDTRSRAERLLVEASEGYARLLSEERTLLAQVELERENAALAQAERDEAARLIEEANA